MFHSIFCINAECPNGQIFAHWIIEAVAFDDIPRFDPPFEQLDLANWTAIDVVYDDSKRPVQFRRYTAAECVARVDDAVMTMRDRGLYREKHEIVTRLKQSKQVYVVEFDELMAGDNVWELLDVIETRIAREYEGLIFSSDEGVFDGRNQPLCSFT